MATEESESRSWGYGASFGVSEFGGACLVEFKLKVWGQERLERPTKKL